jgi:hypothetical protein
MTHNIFSIKNHTDANNEFLINELIKELKKYNKNFFTESNNYLQLIRNFEGHIICRHKDCIDRETDYSTNEKTMEILFDDKNITINIYTGPVYNGPINNGIINNETINNNINCDEIDDNVIMDLVIYNNYEIFNDDIFTDNNNLELVKNFKENEFRKLFVEGLKTTSCGVAKLLWYINKDKYMCSNNNWYVFNDTWKLLETNFQINKKIYVELPEYYKKLAEYFKKENNNNKINFVNKIINSFKNTQFKSDILFEMKKLFRSTDEKFESKLNTNPTLLGFNNGVFDFDKMEFRKSLKEDFISMSVGYNYLPDKSEYYNELIQFLEDIQPNTDDRNYILKLLSLSLVADNTQELLHVFSGVDTIGLNRLLGLIKLTFGDYFEMITSATLAKKQSMRRTDLLVLKNKRIVIASKPEPNQKLNSSVIKQLTDNDSTITVFIGNNPIQLNPQLYLILLHDNIPVFDDNNTRLWNRTRCINFSEKNNDKPKSKNILNYWKNDFMLLLIEYYIKFAKNLRLRPTKNIVVFGDVN